MNTQPRTLEIKGGSSPAPKAAQRQDRVSDPDRPSAEARAALALEKLTRVRIQLVCGRSATAAFFATLALRLVARVGPVGTAATNGQDLIVDPEWWLELSEKERTGVVVHEILHLALQHHTRRSGRESRLWNIACDLAINPLVGEGGFALPSGALQPLVEPFSTFPPRLSAEAYYERLLELREQSPDTIESLLSRPAADGDCGQVLDAANDSGAIQASATAWEINVRQAANAARESAIRFQKGTVPLWLERTILAATAPKVDWREVLQRFVALRVKDDYSWTRPNRRTLASGVILPGLDGERLGRIVVAIDTSGSISKGALQQFVAEVQAIAQIWEPEITVLFHDSAIAAIEEWLPGDPPPAQKAKGFGGTSHLPIFEWVEANAVDAVALICLTDLHTFFPKMAPAVPVLWVTVGSTTAPFGEVVAIEGTGQLRG